MIIPLGSVKCGERVEGLSCCNGECWFYGCQIFELLRPRLDSF